MPVELLMLAFATVWLFALIVASAAFAQPQRTFSQLAGSRDDLPAPTGRFARAVRTVDNHREGLILYAPFAIIVVMTGAADATSALGAQIFFYSRVAHGILYLVGVPWIRTLAWIAGIVGTGMVAWPIFF